MPSPGTIISVPSRLELELESNVILEFPSASKLVSEVSVLLLFETSIGPKVGRSVVTVPAIEVAVGGVLLILDVAVVMEVVKEDKLLGVFAVLGGVVF